MDYDSEAGPATFSRAGRGPVIFLGVKGAGEYDADRRNAKGQTSHACAFQFVGGEAEGKTFSTFLRAPDATAETNSDAVARGKANKTVSGEINELLIAFGVDPAEAAKSLKQAKSGRALWVRISELLKGKESAKWAVWSARDRGTAGSFDTLTWISPRYHAGKSDAGGKSTGTDVGAGGGAADDNDIPF